MAETPFTPSQDYWDQLRSYEEVVFERNKQLTPQIFPEHQAAEVWSSGLCQPIGPDTIAYSASKKLLKEYRSTRLALFSFSDISSEGIARLFEVYLRPESEKILSFPVWTKLTHRGLAEGRHLDISRQRFAAARIARKVPGVLLPNHDDYNMVHEQLQRGATGAYTRWSPAHDLPDEQR